MGMDSVKKRKILENIKIQYCNWWEFGEKHKKTPCGWHGDCLEDFI